MKISFLIFLSILNFRVHAATLDSEMSSPQGQFQLDQITETHETQNDVTLLHLGKNSLPMRRKLLDEAKRYVFLTVPFWNYDAIGTEMATLIRNKKLNQPNLEVRVIQGWMSPILSHEGGKIGDILGKIRELWNSPTWQRNFSFNVTSGHVHEKIFVVDDRLIMGGMNTADEYLQGGTTQIGWHDTDVLIDGPAAQSVAKMHAHMWTMAKYLKGPGAFPPWRKLEIDAFRSFFYSDSENHDFTSVDSNLKKPVNNPVHIPIQDYLRNPSLFPPVSEKGTSRVRVIYDNPLLDRSPETGEHYSKVENTLSYLLTRVRRQASFFMPYLTLDQRTVAELETAARRQVKVRIVTNSLETNDMGEKAFLQAASNFQRLVDAGVKIYLWQGNTPMQNQALENNCTVAAGEWPGHTIHSKIALFDNSVAMIGSDNMNQQSFHRNSELMALIRDRKIANQVAAIFHQDIHPKFSDKKTFHCSEKDLPRPDTAVLLTPTRLKALRAQYQIGEPTYKYSIGY